MRQVHRYVKETESDVMEPEDIVTAMAHDGGMAKCAVELVSVTREGPRIQLLRDAVDNRNLSPLKRVRELEYNEVGDGT